VPKGIVHKSLGRVPLVSNLAVGLDDSHNGASHEEFPVDPTDMPHNRVEALWSLAHQVRQAMPIEVNAPVGSAADSLVDGASFHDSWAADAAEPDLSALGQFLKCARQTPRWIESCMALRNWAVGLVGLQRLGGLSSFDHAKPQSAFQPGERIGIFTLLSSRFEEAVLGIDDAHLDVRLSVHRQTTATGTVRVTVTTVVKVHNTLGRLYMLPVKPMHRIIAPVVLNAVTRPSSAAEQINQRERV